MGSARASSDQVFYRWEIQPLQQRFLAINDSLGIEVVKFRERQTGDV